jgi:DNA-binding transcriptional MocR family regulator
MPHSHKPVARKPVTAKPKPPQPNPSTTNHYAYQQLAQQLREQIDAGQLASGARMPSVRNLCRDSQLSKSTVLSAYTRLEADGVIEARPRSGYFVCAKAPQPQGLKAPALSQPSLTPAPVSATQVLVDIMQQGAAFDLLPRRASNEDARGPMSTSSVHGETTESEAENLELRRCLARALRRQDHHQQLYYDSPAGLAVLRAQLAQRMALSGSQVNGDDLLITSGCQHSLLLALMATTTPGDLVALESPGFYGALQLLETLGLKALELSSDANTGISPEALALAVEHWDIKALILTPAFATPTGSLMPDAHKREILTLTVPRQIAVIEDDIYGELSFGAQSSRPRSLHSYEQELFGQSASEGSVLLCSSFSKCLSRDLRLGWIAPGRYGPQVQRLKLVTALATSQTQQLGLSEFLSTGGLDRHLRNYRQRLQQQSEQLKTLIGEYLPMAISCSQPEGGLCLWLELPNSVDSIGLYARARDAGVIVTPGALFSSQNRYQHFLRLSFAHPWTPERIDALKRLGELIAIEFSE